MRGFQMHQNYTDTVESILNQFRIVELETYFE